MITALTMLKTHLFKCAQAPCMKCLCSKHVLETYLMFLPCQDAKLPSGDFGVHRYQGHVSAALVLGGVDFNGPHLFTVRFKVFVSY